MSRQLLVVIVSLFLLQPSSAKLRAGESGGLAAALDQLVSCLPADARSCRNFDATVLDTAVKEVEAACAEESEQGIVPDRSPAPACQKLIEAKQRVDAQLERLLSMRGEFAGWEQADERDETIRRYLRAVSRLIELSGRLRYLQYDAFDFAAAFALPKREWQAELLQLATTARSVAAADAWSVALAPASDDSGRRAATLPRLQVLQLVDAAGDFSLLPGVVECVRDPRIKPQELLSAAETIRNLGLPQEPRPQDGKDAARPLITARELQERVQAIDEARLESPDRQRRTALLDWLKERNARGVVEDRLKLGDVEVQPGDWLLMRNPSPYNHFSNLSPGLFTHVGVITDEVGPDGRRRIVVVDLPERGNRMPATNFDTFILRTLHYVVLRHPDPAVAGRMADVARQLIGSPTEFDLNFDTSRITALQGKIAPGAKVKTYCAGLLLICSQETPLPREEFFPLAESVAGGRTAENLATLGLSVGKDFISPTGPLFSPRLELVALREPLYEPGREIREAIYDHFAAGLAGKQLSNSPGLQQALRIRLAEMARENRLLATALARANDVSADLDLVAAAKAAAVVETLDEVADAAAGGFFDARDAIQAGTPRELRALRLTRAELRGIEELRRRHAELYRGWERRAISPRELREVLVAYYVQRGKNELDARFFSKPTVK